MILDKSKNAAPLYIQIYENLKHSIENEEYKTGDLIPSENKLMVEYDVSRMTARLAVLELVKFDLVERKRGTGTIVKSKKIEESLKRVTSFTQEMRNNNVIMITSLCSIEKIKATFEVAKALDIEEGSNIFKLKRIRTDGKKPLVYSITYLNIKDLDNNPECYRSSLYSFLSSNYDIAIVKAFDKLEAVNCSLEIEKLLQIKKKAPVFKRTRVSLNQENKKVEYSISFYPGERYIYSIEL